MQFAEEHSDVEDRLQTPKGLYFLALDKREHLSAFSVDAVPDWDGTSTEPGLVQMVEERVDRLRPRAGWPVHDPFEAVDRITWR